MKRDKREASYRNLIIILILVVVLFFAWNNYEKNSYQKSPSTDKLGSLYAAAVPTGKCVDSDGGENYTLKGKTCTRTSCKEDYCTSNILKEYFCQSGLIKNKNYDCAQNGKICSNGACIASCTNECSSSGLKQCSGNGIQTCGNYDTDSCLEWSSVTACSTGQICSNGNCIVSCTNECSSSGLKQCSGNGIQTCGNYDTDSCLEWSSVTACLSGQACSNGNCSANNSTNNTITKPDLIIDNIVFLESIQNSTSWVTVNITVKNIGDGSAGASSTTRTDALSSINHFTLNLAPGQSQLFIRGYACTSAHNFNASADFLNVIIESNEINNDKTVSIDCVI